jgi:hypothetical protein
MTPEIKTARDVAKHFLRLQLIGGPADVASLFQIAEIKGIGRTTLRRA